MPKPDEVDALKQLSEYVEALSIHRALLYDPYPKQAEFHRLGLAYRKRCLMAGNQVGKTTAAGFETRCHMTGLYPDWWQGRRFETPVRCWVGGPDMTHVRDNAQKVLFGPPDAPGTGMIERDLIVKTEKARGIQDALDYALVRHVSGGNSYVKFKSYDQDVAKWSGDTLHFIWFDEEPPEAIYKEGITRTNAGDGGRPGIVYLTLTPLLGLTAVALIFHPYPSEPDAAIVRMGLRDALHYRPEDIEAIARTYKEHERRARVEGKPQLGEGAVFPHDLEIALIDMPERLRWWIYLGGLDFGGAGEASHPSAAIEVAWDRETDVVYALREHRMKGATIPTFASALRRWSEPNAQLPFSWPHDGWVNDRQSGSHTADLFRNEGLLLFQNHATYDDGSRGLEDSVGEVNARLANGTLKIVRSCQMLREEMESYRREKGRIVKERDDLISALRYALMMKRYGVSHWAEGRRIKVLGLQSDPLAM